MPLAVVNVSPIKSASELIWFGFVVSPPIRYSAPLRLTTLMSAVSLSVNVLLVTSLVADGVVPLANPAS